ncbi:MAG: N-terminal double-transrane protein [Planctomycetota bacterium]|nr:N-terminal double-transrane protein [Planctomycetota bacterium]
MGSIFLNVGLVAGVSLAALPVILHLFMKQTPKHIIFPALRLIRERQKRSRKKLRVKNWLLLLARMCLLALMALALARPRIDVKASLGTGDEPTAVAFVFDTSLSMGYKERERTRLDEAKERASDALKKMNDQSRVFIIDSSDPAQPVAQTPAAARKKIQGLTIHTANRLLNSALGAAYTAVATVDLPRREVYVLTDLAASQWQTGQEVEGLAEATKSIKKGKIDTFVLRVGAKEVRDVAIVSAEMASPVATEDDPVILKVKLRNVGQEARRIVEYYLDGQVSPSDKKPVKVPAGGEIDVPPLITAKLKTGLHRIEVLLVGERDPLEFDDRRYVTFEVQPAMKILVISDNAIDSEFIAESLAPSNPPPGLPRPFQVERIRTGQLSTIDSKPLRQYSGVFLSNVKQLDETWWRRLNSYVRDGGGLVVAPAGNADIANYNSGIAAQLLPATLETIRVHPPETPFGFGQPDLGSPLFAKNQKELLGELARVPIYKTRSVKFDRGSAQVVLRYTDNSPALLERNFPGPRQGKVLLWTTALSRRTSSADPQAWNEFPSTAAGWGFLAVIDQTAYYLAGAVGQRLVFEAGEDASLPLDPARHFTAFAVRGPNVKQGERTAETVPGGILVASPGEIGQWTVVAKEKDGPERELGFSINPPRGEMQTTTLEVADLNTLFGKGKYQLANDAASLVHVQGVARHGFEMFPWIMALVLLVVTLENLLANTFYRERSAPASPLVRATA